MGRTNWLGAVALFVGLMGPEVAAADTSDSLMIEVAVFDEVGLPADVLDHAQQKAGRIFAAAGITVAWISPEQSSARSLIVKLGTIPAGQEGKYANVLGVAARSDEACGRVVWLFYRPIHDLALFLRLDLPQLLGHLMAHEIGHLLLPSGSHTAAGLMKGTWDETQASLARTDILTFDPSQAAVMRARIQECTKSMWKPQ